LYLKGVFRYVFFFNYHIVFAESCEFVIVYVFLNLLYKYNTAIVIKDNIQK